MSTMKLIYGALAGLAAGVAIGILTAPDSGEETRKRIRRSAHDVNNRFRRIVGKGADGLSELKYIFENETTGLKDDVKERVLKIIDESNQSYTKFKKEALS
ncbi:YtxH domain-containing protein [Chitinophaga sancti]|uniref:YtxH domain-containing protein n=1 Tax=Chitinophaga sancti TaxID=1004 RepID=UPI002A760D3D|nr:YtxH domain-containing protein [Chitinophaga sancti]WPQ62155.1 YtxH domain-containing protein [Chitinophaga sancti]